MTGDMSNAELGVAQSDAVGAKGRLSDQNGLAKQHNWSMNYLNERTIASLVILCTIAVIVVWAIETTTIVRYGVTAVVLFLIVTWIVSKIKNNSELRALRKNQIKDHASKT